MVTFPDPGGSGKPAYKVTKAHPAQFPVTVRGNPGPWLRYDPKKGPDAVPYFAVTIAAAQTPR